MSRTQKLIVSFLLVYIFLCRVQCAKELRKGNLSKEDDTENGNHHQNRHHNTDLPHRLETAPIPAVHTGPQPIKIETRSAPIALDRSTDPSTKELERVNRHISSSNSPNPQKPTGWNGIVQKENKTNNEDSVSSRFNHPGHTQMSNNYPTNYNYYNDLKVYGSAYQYGSNEPFKGYRETKNIGVIPPRYVSANSNYDRSNILKDIPTIVAQQAMRSSQYARQRYPTYGYGYGTRGDVKNAYRNVLTGLVMWSIMNGLATGKRYTLYNHKSIPENFQNQIILSNNTLIECLEDASFLCQYHAEPLCVNNGTLFCVTSAIVPCQNERVGNTCANVTIPCNDCSDNETNYLPCIANLTIANESDGEDSNVKQYIQNESDNLCVTVLMVPKEKNQESCNDSTCFVSGGENNSEARRENVNG